MRKRASMSFNSKLGPHSSPQMDKRYQVFVSSTYADLQEERQEVMQALLELDCIPAGMELFPAANEDQWTLIKKVIDDCDYYIVIVAGRYGSVGPDRQSFTEMEYRYALAKGKPVIGFVHKDPGILPANRCEQDAEGKAKLEHFRELVKQKMCRFWDSPADLGSQVSRSLVKLIKTHPGVGWVRGDLVPDASAAEEMLRLRKHIEQLEGRLAAASVQAPEGTASLAQGDDEYDVSYRFEAYPPGKSYESKGLTHSVRLSWNDIFATVSPLMIDEAPESALRAPLNDLIGNFSRPILKDDKNVKGMVLRSFRIDEDDFQTIKVQLRALGLISKSTKNRSVKDTQTYWTLTPYGDTVMIRLRAIERNDLFPADKSGEKDGGGN